jgi:hypothetical protein
MFAEMPERLSIQNCMPLAGFPDVLLFSGFLTSYVFG